MADILLTGFPGFLGSELLPRILGRRNDDQAVCLVQSKFAALAYRRVEELVLANPALLGRLRLVEGDITRPDLGLEDGGIDPARVAEIYHLAAVYDLSVPRPVGIRVNVEGTRHLLSFAATCSALERFHYVSTCYVSGRHPGVFREVDLDVGQAFNNYYEETKYLAEIEVQRAMDDGLPATIYRPSVVVGDSQTGATQKFDGPYYVMRWLLKQPWVATLPMIGNPTVHRVNLVPSDFVIQAIAHLSGQAASRGRVYQLADPAPLTVDALVDEVARATGRLVLRLPLPLSIAKLAIDHVPGVYALMGIPSAAIDYFVHPTTYDTENTLTDLADTGIAAPPFASYVDRLVAFLVAHPEIEGRAMV